MILFRAVEALVYGKKRIKGNLSNRREKPGRRPEIAIKHFETCS
jgi:hypothetical protein